jgi:hypothetical protein
VHPLPGVACSETRQWAFSRELLAAVGAVAAADLPSRCVPLWEASSDRNSRVDDSPAVRAATHRHGRTIVIVVCAPPRSLHVVPPPDPIPTLHACVLPSYGRDRDSASRRPSETSDQKRLRTAATRRASRRFRSHCRRLHHVRCRSSRMIKGRVGRYRQAGPARFGACSQVPASRIEPGDGG